MNTLLKYSPSLADYMVLLRKDIINSGSCWAEINKSIKNQVLRLLTWLITACLTTNRKPFFTKRTGGSPWITPPCREEY